MQRIFKNHKENRKGKESEIIIVKPISRGGVAKNL